MPQIKRKEVVEYVEKNISSFHQARFNSLERLKLKNVLKRKNPYLFKAKNILTAQDLMKAILDAHLSSQEETLFGEFLEGLAIYVCQTVYQGYKSASAGIDLEVEKDSIRYIVSIKSGPNWGNSEQIKKMKENFRSAMKTLRTSNSKINVIAINGCCYGRDNNPQKSEYVKLCGQRFWEFISGDNLLYLDIIEPLGHKAKEKNEIFFESYAQILNKFTLEFMNEFCVNGIINWNKLLQFNSSAEVPPRKISKNTSP
ncbi:MAG: cytosolic protein [Bacteroidetes bacterium]|nr:MAG: cytosolic protein [Bacteroidota bacterium]